MKVLQDNGFSQAHAEAITNNVVLAQTQECFSHGVYRLRDCINAARLGGLSPTAEPVFVDRSAAITQCDARGGCSLLSFELGKERLMQNASEVGIATLAINNCFHFSALWAEVEALSIQGYVGLAMTPTHPYTAPAGGKAPLLGTNPFAFSWPRPGSRPYTFDFATSEVARGEIELHAKHEEAIPEGWAIDTKGKPTTDPHKALEGALLTFGSYKGSAISTMVELIAGPLIGDKLGHETAPAAKAHQSNGPLHGEMIIAMDPKVFLGDATDEHTSRAENLFDEIISQGARLPSQRRHEAAGRNSNSAIPVQSDLLCELKSMRRY